MSRGITATAATVNSSPNAKLLHKLFFKLFIRCYIQKISSLNKPKSINWVQKHNKVRGGRDEK